MDEKIIIYRSFDNGLLANIARTKLDAFDIPCFLSEENFTNLYPFRNQIFPGVRLHIFQKDILRVTELLNENS